MPKKKAGAQVAQGRVDIFISWSGSGAKMVAEALKGSLQTVIQAVEPFVSATDIEKGSRWRTEIDARLAASDFGLVCLTRENVAAPWIHFEAGALAKAVNKSGEVVPLFTYLIGITQADVKGPLSEYQHTLATKEDTLKLLQSLNRVVLAKTGRSLQDEALRSLFESIFWPKLEPVIAKAEKHRAAARARTQEDMLGEILDLVRAMRAREEPRSLLPLTGSYVQQYGVPSAGLSFGAAPPAVLSIGGEQVPVTFGPALPGTRTLLTGAGGELPDLLRPTPASAPFKPGDTASDKEGKKPKR